MKSSPHTAVVLMALFGVAGCQRARDAEEAARLRPALVPHADAAALSKFDALAPAQRVDLARRTLDTLPRLQKSGWRLRIKDLTPPGDEAPASFVYQLGVGQSELLGCTNVDTKTPRAQCSAFSHAPPGTVRSRERLTQHVPLNVTVGAPEPFAFSSAPVMLRLASRGPTSVAGLVRVDAYDVHVRRPVLLVPRPLDPQFNDGVPLRDIALRDTTRLRSTSEYTLEIAVDVPQTLQGLLARQRIEIVQARGMLEVRIDEPLPAARIEADVAVLGRPTGRVLVEYSPGEYISAAAALPYLRVPTAIPGVTAQLDAVLFEVELRDKRVRLAGQVSAGLGSLVMAGTEVEDNPFAAVGREIVSHAVTKVGDTLGLPPSARAQAHLLIDWDDPLLCVDIGVQDKSVLRAAYVGTDGMLYMWAPKSHMFQLPRRFRDVVNIPGLFVDLYKAPWSMYERDPLHCYPGDPGPRVALRSRLL